jgi:hypothetical protein
LADDDCSTLDNCKKDGDCKNGEKCKNSLCRGTWACLTPPDGMKSPELKVCRDNTDNDGDGKVDEMPTACDDPAKLSQTEPLDYAKAIELCDTDHACGLEKGCPGALKCVNNACRRVINATFSSGDPTSRAVSTAFPQVGGPVGPRANQAFAVLASGKASYDPKVLCPQSGTDFGTHGTDPDPTAVDNEANDLSELKLEIVVPTNAQSFSFDFQFLTTEYPEWLGSSFNDTFWVQLNSKKINGNISFDKNGTPIRLNNAFFDICDPDPFKPPTSGMCTQPASVLNGTGYGSGDCCGGTACGGSTGWLTTTAPVTPGEKITLTFSIFDKGDGILDSAVVIDNFRWRLTPALAPSTGPD